MKTARYIKNSNGQLVPLRDSSGTHMTSDDSEKVYRYIRNSEGQLVPLRDSSGTHMTSK
ncbi:MAG: hypothetical protein OXU36_10535 [Candidatus Poribacteria bacterium]|nr:hypothetical protein [Candidatus Poribacteria bacterium]